MGSFGNSLSGNREGETAKSLLVCKAALSRALAFLEASARDREPQEVYGNVHPRYMTVQVYA